RPDAPDRGVARIRLVRRHLERCFGMACTNANGRQAFCCQRMVAKPIAAPSRTPLAGPAARACGSPPRVVADLTGTCRARSFVHPAESISPSLSWHVEADVLLHGCPPFDV